MLKEKKLNLPIIKGTFPNAKRLSMDDYVKFVVLNLKYTIDKRVVRKQKRLAAVNVAFSLK
jgi:hypothetical protein